MFSGHAGRNGLACGTWRESNLKPRNPEFLWEPRSTQITGRVKLSTNPTRHKLAMHFEQIFPHPSYRDPSRRDLFSKNRDPRFTKIFRPFYAHQIFNLP